jgi:hypothetical protein
LGPTGAHDEPLARCAAHRPDSGRPLRAHGIRPVQPGTYGVEQRGEPCWGWRDGHRGTPRGRRVQSDKHHPLAPAKSAAARRRQHRRAWRTGLITPVAARPGVAGRGPVGRLDRSRPTFPAGRRSSPVIPPNHAHPAMSRVTAPSARGARSRPTPMRGPAPTPTTATTPPMTTPSFPGQSATAGRRVGRGVG